MFRVFVVYEEKPDPSRYQQHVELCRKVDGGTFRHGEVFGAPMGEPQLRYYAEWEFPDRVTFEAATKSPAFMESGNDAMAMGVRFQVHYAEVT